VAVASTNALNECIDWSKITDYGIEVEIKALLSDLCRYDDLPSPVLRLRVFASTPQNVGFYPVTIPAQETCVPEQRFG
jgi:hypothetical protein